MALEYMVVTFRILWNEYVASQGTMEFFHTLLKSHGVLAVKAAEGTLIVLKPEGHELRFQMMKFVALLPGGEEEVRVMVDNVFKIGLIPQGREWQVLSRRAGEEDVKSFEGKEV